MTKLVHIKAVRGKFHGERIVFDAFVRVNPYAGTAIYQRDPIVLRDGRTYIGQRLDNAIAPSLERKIARLARRAARHGQEIVDWSAL